MSTACSSEPVIATKVKHTPLQAALTYNFISFLVWGNLLKVTGESL
jgi:hypothetical protein